jgi:hypothetical protein
MVQAYCSDVTHWLFINALTIIIAATTQSYLKPAAARLRFNVPSGIQNKPRH